ncbi:16S rRNA (cytosine(967)-C(5))-methyltransferase RsmB [Limosilactobacillus pontis]|uniref:16S rRNA (cytosine(967)-C(5))-methyltransferase n=1 Tax=Limosilactobacillus pontis TaxID=35787 RepID=A0ABU7ST41_9LACO
MTKKTQTTARGVALTALERIRQGAYSNIELDQLLSRTALKDSDRRLATNIVYGVLQHRLTLEYWLRPFIHRKLDSWVETLLWMSIYQYHYLDRVPDWAVTNESIELAKQWGNPGTRKFVTGVLHAILRQGLADLDTIADPAQCLATKASVPAWMVKRFVDQYGQPTTEKLLTAINQPAHVAIRVNPAITTMDQVTAALDRQGVEYRPSEIAPDALVITKGEVLSSDLFAQGAITVQDESAMLAVDSMGVQPGDRVLDACAAPGGKTVQVASRLTAGQVDALDIHQHKTRLIEKNARRLHVADRVVTHTLDARQVDSAFADSTFDKVLVDAPCSGIGLLRRKPEIRYSKRPADSDHLHQIQLAILNTVAPKVKKGGIITYSTCTILNQENNGTVRAFLADHPDFELVRTKTTRHVKDDRTSTTLTILPSDFGSDGFFISTLRRVK